MVEILVPKPPVERKLGVEGRVQKSLWGSIESPHRGPYMPRGQDGLTSQISEPRHQDYWKNWGFWRWAVSPQVKKQLDSEEALTVVSFNMPFSLS